MENGKNGANIKNIFVQGLIIVALFFAFWFSLSKINWVKILHVEKATNTTEEKLGDLFWEFLKKTQKEVKTKSVNVALDSIVSKICTANNIDKNTIQVHIIQSEEINAFALPNRHLVINSALILDSQNEAALAGVIGHEIAHIQLSHVMKKLVKEIGLSVLISMTTGKSGSGTIQDGLKLLSSSAYDRNLEKEADLKAVDYLIKADINPAPFADFLYQFSESEEIPELKYLTWINTHPDSKERAEYIVEYSENKTKKSVPILSITTWNKLKEKLADN